MKKLIFIVLACSLFILPSCKAKSATTATTPPPTVEQLQAQIKDISLHMTAQSALISSLQVRLKTNQDQTTTQPVITTTTGTATTTTPPPVSTTTPAGITNKQISDDIDFLTLNLNNMETEIEALQNQIVDLQTNLIGNATNIGVTSTTINGLSVLFVTNDIDVGPTGSTTPNSAQFAIKITNTTNTVINNLDIIGTITSANNIAGYMASAYPQMTDASGLSSISFSNTTTNITVFESYGSKGSLSIPVGGSITLRPKISFLAVSPQKLPATTFTIAIKAITYDLPTLK